MPPLLRRPRPLRSYADRRYARKIAVARGLCLALFAALAALLVAAAADGTIEVTVSRTNARFAGPSVLRTITWADAPVPYALYLAASLAIAAAFAGALYVVLARVVERTHGRPFPSFRRRRYPH